MLKFLKSDMKYLILILVFTVASCLLGYSIGINSTTDYYGRDKETIEELEDFYNVYSILRKYHYFDSDQTLLIDEAIRAMIAATDDPYTQYFNEEEFAEFMKNLETSFGGIGVMVSLEDGKIVVIDLLDGMPASNIGIEVGDIIVNVDGIDVTNKTVSEVALLISGDPDTTVKVTVKRGAEEIEYDVTRAIIPNITVFTDYNDENEVGTITVTSFGKNTDEDFDKAINELEAKNIKGLVIDLRNNGGGYLDTVFNMLSSLLPKDTLILKTEDKAGNIENFYTNRNTEKKDYDIVVLVNEYSASASEVFAAAMNEAGGYEVLGEVTYGKGSVQVSIPLDEQEDSLIKITIKIWLTPNGNWINEIGVKPTIEVDQPDIYNTNLLIVDKNYIYDTVGAQVANMQAALKALGYDIDRTDGYFSTQTEIALRDFEATREELTIDGILDEKTAYYINAEIFDVLKDKTNDYQLQQAIYYAIN